MSNKLTEIIEKVIDNNPFKFLEDLFSQKEGMLFILKYLYKSEKSVKAGELATALNVSTARISLLLKKLENKNYITRTQGEKDARIVYVTLTEEGRKYTYDKMTSFMDKLKKLIDSLGFEKIEQFLTLSNEINTVLCN